MNSRAKALLAVAAVICLIPTAAFAGIIDFAQDFESLGQADPTALSADGWFYYVTVFAAADTTTMYGYGGGAPNTDSPVGISRIISGEGGPEQGLQQLSVFSDYNNAVAHTAGDFLETNVYKEFTIQAGDVGKVCTFEFSAKLGNLIAPSTATAFIKTIDPGSNYDQTNFVFEDMTNITSDWGGWSLSLTIDAGLVGQLFQVGFANFTTDYVSSSIVYDNVVLTTAGGGPTGMDPYSQDFEALDSVSLTALGDDGWLTFATVFSGVTGDYLYEYGPNPAPNNPSAPAFSSIAVGEGGAGQGAQQMSVFSDYENGGAQAAGDLIEANVYQEQEIGTADVGKTWVFQFQAKMPSVGGVAPPTTAMAFIKTIDPGDGYAQTNLFSEDMSNISTEWDGYTLFIYIDAGLVGQLCQFGFTNTATNYDPSAIIYDNVIWSTDVSSVPDNMAFGGALRQNYPNPFNPMTRIEFSLDKPGRVDIAVYDLGGRLVANLLNETMGAGDHYVNWNGQARNGTPAAAGQYHYVMRTETGQMSRSMILLK